VLRAVDGGDHGGIGFVAVLENPDPVGGLETLGQELQPEAGEAFEPAKFLVARDGKMPSLLTGRDDERLGELDAAQLARAPLDD